MRDPKLVWSDPFEVNNHKPMEVMFVLDPLCFDEVDGVHLKEVDA